MTATLRRRAARPRVDRFVCAIFLIFFSDVFFIEFPTRAKAVLSTIAPRVPALKFAQGGGEMMSGKITKK